MKRLSLLLIGSLPLLGGYRALGQTNTFPASGNVGIGTVSPQATQPSRKSLVVQDTTNDVTIRLLGSGGVDSEWITSMGSIGLGVRNAGKINFFTSSLNRVTIDSAGNVGIGTTNPTQKLQFAPGSFIGLPLSKVNVPTSWQRGGNGIILAGAENTDGSGWAYGSRIVTFDYGDGTNLEWDSLRNGVWTNSTLVVSGRLGKEGNIGIGTASPTHKLSVNGTIRAKEVIVDTGWSDYVFATGYKLASLSEVETHIKENGHLPGIPSAKEVAEHGVSMGEMQSKLLAKIEELTLHQIEQEKELKRLDAENRELHAILHL